MTIVICPTCGRKNPSGAEYCQECWKPLPSAPSDVRRSTIPMPMVSADTSGVAASQRKARRTAHVGKLKPRSIALYFEGQSEPLIVTLDEPITLGRATLLDFHKKFVDLLPFGAAEKGVSRQHCLLTRSDSGVMVQDMGSSNGTWLDDVPLKPHQPTLITSGARLRLATLELEIYLPE